MKAFLIDLFEYHHYFNLKILEQCEAYEALVSNPAKALLSHCFNAHQIWNSRILNLPPIPLNTLHTFLEMEQMENENFTKSISILNTRNLSEVIYYSNSKGEAYSNTIQDILFHITNHFTHHKAQLILDLKASGIQPLVTDYIFYKR